MKLPKISIVIPSYNQGRFIEETLQSIWSQDYPHVEVIVMDGGSADETVGILQKYTSRIRYWESCADGGQGAAVNKGILRASGDVIGWINSDDIYLPGAFRRVAKAFVKEPGVGVVHGDRFLYSEDSIAIGWTALGAFEPGRYGYTVCSESAFWSRRINSEHGMFLDESLRFAMDLEWFSRLYYEGFRFKKINSHVGALRLHGASKSSTMQDIGTVEAELYWWKYFKNTNLHIAPPENLARMVFALAKNPLTLGMPYLRRKVAKCIGYRAERPL